MDIKNINSVNFSSRNATIRHADDIVRKVNKEFPRISLSIVQGMKNVDKFSRLEMLLDKKMAKVRSNKLYDFMLALDFEEKLKSIVDPVKGSRMGNCSESGNLAVLALKVNGIKNCRQMRLTTKEGRDFDHSIVIVDDKKPYIVDAWLGFVDYLPKAIERYKKEYRNHFDFDKLQTEEMVISEPQNFAYTSHFVNRDFTGEELKTVKTLYSELILK